MKRLYYTGSSLGFISKAGLAVSLLCLLAGTLTAVAPESVTKLLIIPFLVLVMIISLLMRSDKPVSEGLSKCWIVALLAVMALWPTYMFIKIGSLPALDARRIIAGLSLCLMLFFFISRKPISTAFYKDSAGPLRVGIMLVSGYTLFRIVSCFVAPNPISSLISVGWEILYYYSFFFVGALFFSRDSLRYSVMLTFMVLAVIVSLFAVVEMMLHENILVQFAPSGKEFEEFHKVLTSSRIRDGLFRSQGTFEHPLLLGEFAAMAFCFGIAGILWPTHEPYMRTLSVITTFLTLVASILSGSRSAYLALAISFVFVFLLKVFFPNGKLKKSVQGIRKTFFFFTLVSLLLLSVPIISLLAQGKTTQEATSSEARVIMLNLGLPSIEENPVLGTGPETGAEIAGIIGASGVRTLDNYFLSIAIESGVPALLLLLSCLLYPVWIVVGRMAVGTIDHVHFFTAAAGALIVTTVVHTVFFMPYNFSFAFFFSGIILASSSLSVIKEPSEK